MTAGILKGLRVLDFTWVLAGPYATRILADFGAEVIKVQSKKTAKGTELNTSAHFKTWNRNKLGITLNLDCVEGREIILRLVEKCDVVIENFTPRVMQNWGLDYENLRKIKPELIMVSMSGAGHTGPWRDFVAFGPTIQALSGMTYLTSFTPDSPMGMGYSYADHVVGLYGALAVLIALEYREKTGKGQHIDISEYEAMCTFLGPALMSCAVNDVPVLPKGNLPDYAFAAPYGCFRCFGEDKWCTIAVFTEEEWQALCKILGNPPWSKEKKFSNLRQRMQHIDELNHLVETWTLQYSLEDIMKWLQEAGVAAGVVQDVREVALDKQLAYRNFFVQNDLSGMTISESAPIRLGRTLAKFKRSAPLLGEDNHYVYRDILGMSEQELSQYIKDGVIN